MPLIEKAQYFLFELATSFAGDDLDKFDFTFESFFNDPVEFRLDLIALVVNIVQVKFELCHHFPQGEATSSEFKLSSK